MDFKLAQNEQFTITNLSGKITFPDLSGEVVLSSELSSKQDKLTDAQVSAINAVVGDRKTIVTYTDGTTTAFDIEGTLENASISTIADVATVKIGTAVTSLGDNVFNGGSSISSVVIPDSVTSIGGEVFSKCSSFTSVTIPDSVTIIGPNAFSDCSSLTNVTFRGKSTAEVQEMDGYSWGITDTSVITTWNDASKEWVEDKLVDKRDMDELGYGIRPMVDVWDVTLDGTTVVTLYPHATLANTWTSGPSDGTVLMFYTAGLLWLLSSNDYSGMDSEVEGQGAAVAELHFSSGYVAVRKAVPGNYPDRLALLSQVSEKYTKPDTGIPVTDLAQAVQTALSAIPRKADAADLRYRIAEAGYATTGAKLPEGVTMTDGGSSVSMDVVDIIPMVGDRYQLRVNGETRQVFWYSDGSLETSDEEDIIFYVNNVAMDQFDAPALLVPRALADRAVNLITATSAAGIDIEIPGAQEGYSRDFYIAVSSGSAAPKLNAPEGVKLIDSKGNESPDLSLTPSATTVLRFTEVKEADESQQAVFCVTGGANGGGTIDPTVLDSMRSKTDMQVYTYESWNLELPSSLCVELVFNNTSAVWTDTRYSLQHDSSLEQWTLSDISASSDPVIGTADGAADALSVQFENPQGSFYTCTRTSSGCLSTGDHLATESQLSAKLDSQAIAPAFSEQLTYDVSDIVSYNGMLYSCISAITVPGPWSGSMNWDEYDIVSDVESIMSDVENKAESTALAPAWIAGHAYFIGDHVSYNGLLYECTATVANDTPPDTGTSNWKLTDLADPDATLDITSSGALRVVAADGTELWRQGYSLKSTSSYVLSNDAVNKYEFGVNAAGAVELQLPAVVPDKVSDFVLDVTNPNLVSTDATYPAEWSDTSSYISADRVLKDSKIWACAASSATSGTWIRSEWQTSQFSLNMTDNSFVVDTDDDFQDLLVIDYGTMSRMWFTLTSFGISSKPTWQVSKQTVKEASS